MVFTFDIWPPHQGASGRIHIVPAEWDILPARAGSDPSHRTGLLIPQCVARRDPPTLRRIPNFFPASILHVEIFWPPSASSQGCRAGDAVLHGENKGWPVLFWLLDSHISRKSRGSVDPASKQSISPPGG